MSLITITTLVLIPVVFVAVDGLAAARARSRTYTWTDTTNDDYTVLVPIWGNVRFFENADYLRRYAERVVLCRTGNETDEFLRELRDLAQQRGFRVFVDEPTDPTTQVELSERATSGTTRDRLIRNALRGVESTCVVPLDADTTTERDLSELVGELASSGFDLASVRLISTPSDSFITRLQRLEYRLAMQLRMVVPWMLSGACHVARTRGLSEVMDHHSLFFQGNDVEIGLIATHRGYRVGHIPFEVTTAVPTRFMDWWRQRLTWSGGEFRLFIVNVGIFARKHPFVWMYGALFVLLALPLRWWMPLQGPSVACRV